MMESPSEISTLLKELSSISQILAAANHRNKNQHRLAKWWKPFSVLRRNTSKLVSELETLSANEERLGETKRTIESRGDVESRVEFLDVWVVPKCYLAFSAVVADNQFANLGLMLVGTLARFQKMIGPLKREIEGDGNDRPETKNGFIGPDGHDFGEIIEREDAEEISTEVISNVEEEEDLVVQPKKPEKKRTMVESRDDNVAEIRPRKKKKRKKDYDEFDALFGRLS